MYKEYISYILIVLIIIEIAFTQPIISENAIDYWTPEKMLNAKLLHLPGIKNKTINNSEKANLFASEDENKNPLLAVGQFFFTLDGIDNACTASVINTQNGNTGMTAKHCLYSNGAHSVNMIFCPGYNKGNTSYLGKILVTNASWADGGDYGVIKFDYNGGLQNKTGSFDWGLTPSYPVRIATFGYPVDGDVNCTHDGKTLCIWRGVADQHKHGNISVPLLLGHGSSGGPWVMGNNPSNPKNLGDVIGITAFGNESHTYSYILNFTLIRELITW
ncbi:serine protease [Gigaspora margarita]|uniref:Serine protease n=1 Tax=Gigaspora margarita TaxID=4874 RepID=A0A8H4AMJ0_GIGMA|nr:serine protease [Gigaspora margarita]